MAGNVSCGTVSNKVVIVIPVYNERTQLEQSVRILHSAAEAWAIFPIEFVVANNGSTDGTDKIAESLKCEFPNVSHMRLREKGRGRALREAWTKSDGHILAYMDVDLSTDISFFPDLLEPLLQGKADVSIGSRLLRPEWTTRGWKRELMSRCYNRLLRSAFDVSFSDAQCGFKAITRTAAKELLPLVKDDEWFFDTELLLLADHLGHRIHDLPVRWNDDCDSRVRILPTVIQDLKGIRRMRRRLRQMQPCTAARPAYAI
jgi:glycosyltransferase involved in cell wall biosynthesis